MLQYLYFLLFNFGIVSATVEPTVEHNLFAKLIGQAGNDLSKVMRTRRLD